jgi:hypothetical protein
MRRIVTTTVVTASVLAMSAVAGQLYGQEGSHDTEVKANLGATRMVFQEANDVQTFTSFSFQQVTGAADITIPPGQQGYLIATFTAQSNCSGGTGLCSVRILCNGVELLPATGGLFAFDSPDDRWESHSVTRRSAKLSSGTKTCKVEAALRASYGGPTSFTLDDWTFMVQYWRSN